MFTGLVEEMGIITESKDAGDGKRIQISCEKVLDDLKIKESISVNGVCLTVIDRSDAYFDVDVVSETLKRSNIGYIKVGDKVNLERSLLLTSRLGGHIVQGHVDGTARIKSHIKGATGSTLTIELAAILREFVVEKGSITLDGISLTIAELRKEELSVALIPHTLETTTLGIRKKGDILNVEVDILGKYVKNMLSSTSEKDILTIDGLKEWGY